MFLALLRGRKARKMRVNARFLEYTESSHALQAQIEFSEYSRIFSKIHEGFELSETKIIPKSFLDPIAAFFCQTGTSDF